MTKHFAAAFAAVSAFLAIASGNAFAQEPTGVSDPLPPAGTSAWVGETGTASYYGPGYHGRQSASGSRFDQTRLTAAHPWLPFGSKVRVSLAGTGRTVIVTITDRLYSSRRIVDLSVAAARQLGMIQRGVAEVSLVPV
jgi:rare lipoprotein A